MLIEGAGPIGMFSALHLFLAGARVVLVNNRPERYCRNTTSFCDPKFIAQFRFLLGTKFDELYLGETVKFKQSFVDQGLTQMLIRG